MTESPRAGWYEDPTSPAQLRYWDGEAWTRETRPTGETPPVSAARSRRIPRGHIGAAAVALILAAAITGFFLASSPDEPAAPPAPPAPPAPVAEPTPFGVGNTPAPPEGWTTFVSESGSITYARDERWLDGADFGYEEEMERSLGFTPGLDWELGGAWVMDLDVSAKGPVVITVLPFSDGMGTAFRMDLTVEEIVDGAARGFEDHVVEYTGDLTTAQGYDARRMRVSGTLGDASARFDVVLIGDDVTWVAVSVTAASDVETYEDALLTIVDTVVIHHPPAAGH